MINIDAGKMAPVQKQVVENKGKLIHYKVAFDYFGHSVLYKTSKIVFVQVHLFTIF